MAEAKVAFSNYLAHELLDHVFGDQSWSAPGTLYVGLSKEHPLNDGTGIDEPSGGAYTREAVTNSTASWEPAAARSKESKIKVTFNTATADWGTLPYWFISDASTGGNMLAFGELRPAAVVETNDQVEFAIGDLMLILT